MLLRVKTKYGIVQGSATNAENISVFRGVPYASPPTGENRWKAPQPLTPWKGVRECFSYAPGCIQTVRPVGNFYRSEFYEHRFHKYPPKFSEDCLYLNIWTPAASSEDKLPVMVWIHGGAFTKGYSHVPRSNGEVLAGTGVIVVSINYRLNIFGFFSHPELSVEQNGHCGNYAIMDQAAAIEWVYENIESFGGDKNNITLFGQSAGSISVQALSVIPQTKGKIRRAIMQSGVQFNLEEFGYFYCSQREMEARGMTFMHVAGKESLKQLREIPAEDLLSIYLDYLAVGHQPFTSLSQDNYLFYKSPADSFLCGEVHIQELIAGATLEETKLHPPIENVTLKNFQEIIANFPQKDIQFIRSVPVNSDEEAKNLINRRFAWHTNGASLALCDHISQIPNKKAYSYSFQRNMPGSDSPGAYHSACIWYAFGNLHICRRPFTDADFELENTMIRYWSNFAKTGDPNAESLPHWKEYTHTEPYSMILDVNALEMADITLKTPSFAVLRDKLIKKRFL